MLQEEGLVEIEPNQRTRVAGLDPQELDELYASRILLETLGPVHDARRPSRPAASARPGGQLTAMRQAARTGDFAAWFDSHAHFHRLMTAEAGPTLQRQLSVFADRTIRYIRIYQLSDPASWQSAGDAEHAAILGGAGRGATAARPCRAWRATWPRTAERVLADCAPDYPVRAVTHAVDLVERGCGPLLPGSQAASAGVS